MKFPFIQQLDKMDCGPACLQMVTKFYAANYSITHLREICDMGKDGSNLLGIKNAANKLGLDGYGIDSSIEEIIELNLFPIILYWNQNHFVVLYDIKTVNNKSRFYISDPAKGKYVLNKPEFASSWIGSIESNSKGKGIGLFLELTNRFESNQNVLSNSKPVEGFSILLKEIKNYKKSYIKILIGIIISLIIQIFIPLLSKALFDFGISENSYSLVIVFIASQFVFTVLNTVITFYRNWITLYIGSRININLISNHLSKLLNLKFSYFDRKSSGDIIQRINDNSRIEDFLTSSAVSFVVSFTSLLVFEIVLIFFDIKLAFLFNGTLILYFLWAAVMLKKIKNLDFQRFDSASKNQSFIVQLINGIQDIKLNNAVGKKVYDWCLLREELFDYNQKFIILKQIQELGSFLILNISSMIIIASTAFAVINKRMTVGELIAIQYILAQLTSPVVGLIQVFKSYNDAKISVKRLNEVNELPYESDQNSEPIAYQIDSDIIFKNVSFSYPGTNGRNSLNNINLTILKGKINAIVGASGSGKTTLIKLLQKMYDPNHGVIEIGNDTLNNIEYEKWRASSSSVMQEGYIFTDTILNNIVISGGEIDKLKLKNALTIANINDFVNQLPHGLHTKIGLDGSGFSQGQKQRLLIARCVYKDPQLIIFDEATNALDSLNENIIYSNLNEFYKNKTVVTIAHRLSTIVNADQIIVFDKGEIAEIGNHDQLLNLKGVYHDLVSRQRLENIFQA